MSLNSSIAGCQLFSNSINGGGGRQRRHQFARASADVPDFLSADWLESRKNKPFGPRLIYSAEEAVGHQLEALKYNDQPHQDYGIEVMYRFAGFDPFERSTYFGPHFDLGQFERFRRIFHHSSYRVLLGHKEREILSSLWVKENLFKQRVWVQGARPAEEEIFEFTMLQGVVILVGCKDFECGLVVPGMVIGSPKVYIMTETAFPVAWLTKQPSSDVLAVWIITKRSCIFAHTSQ